MASTHQYIVRSSVALFILALLFPITYSALEGMNVSATLTAIILGIESVFFIGVLYKLLAEAGIL